MYGHFRFRCRVEVNSRIGAIGTRALDRAPEPPRCDRIHRRASHSGSSRPGPVGGTCFALCLRGALGIRRTRFGSRMRRGLRHGGVSETRALRPWASTSRPKRSAHAKSAYPLPNISFVPASATAVPFRDGSFDLITAFEVIEHLDDWRALVIGSAAACFIPNGVFLVSTPNKEYYTESRGASGPNPFHTHEFEFDEFRSVLARVLPALHGSAAKSCRGVRVLPSAAAGSAH